MLHDDGHEPPEHRAGPTPSTVGLLDRRERALREVAADLGPAHRDADRPAVALRDYGPGCLCLGIAGPVDRAMVALLQVLLAGLRVRGRHDLTITLAGLGPWHPQLARVLGHARIQHLVAGAHVEFHHLPDEMTALRRAGPTTFVVVDPRHVGPPASPPSVDVAMP